MRPWGKIWFKDSKEERHHLAHHCADVVIAFDALMSSGYKQVLDRAAGCSLDDQEIARLKVLVYLHDFGKLAPGFQAKGWINPYGKTFGHVGAAMATPTEYDMDGLIVDILPWFAGDGSLFSAIMAHHGSPVEVDHKYLPAWKSRPGYDLESSTREYASAARSWFSQAFNGIQGALPNSPAFCHAFLGVLSLADWLGSDRSFFPEWKADLDLSYYHRAQAGGDDLRRAVSLSAGSSIPEAVPFSFISPHPDPRSLQAAVGMLSPDEDLVILEGETGSGKTEAALWHFARSFAAGRCDGLYFALPTRASAFQIHDRVGEAMRRGFGVDAPPVTLAVPGQISVDRHKGYTLPDFKVKWDDDARDSRRWAAEDASRFLAAPIAVGTVDQAMRAAIAVKHADLRQSALARRMLVIDEVHASDIYMGLIQKQLVRTHLALGGQAVLMSATLGSEARESWLGHRYVADNLSLAKAGGISYPAIWTSSRTEPFRVEQAGRGKDVSVFLGDDVGVEIANRAAAMATRGARVLIIRNTVTSARETWKAVAQKAPDLLLQVNGGPALHHGRFAAEDRQILDAAIEEALAPRGPSSGVVVIGTQTLEQSLDIDADVLITDICPIDVLLQRIGRLHRHRRDRPKGFEQPQAYIFLPEGGLEPLAAPSARNGLGMNMSGGGGVYRDLRMIEAVRRMIENYPTWSIPNMNRFLVERGTHSEALSQISQDMGWQDLEAIVIGGEMSDAVMAQRAILARDRAFCDLRPFCGEDGISTRLGDGSVVFDLPESPVGPFETPVSRIAIPSWMLRGVDPDIQPDVIKCPSGFRLRFGEQIFSYDRAGLRPASRKADED